jgi:hypothetical protein
LIAAPSRPFAISFRPRAWILPGLLLAACGCGLGDYEEKMVAEQNLLERLEKESKELDDPLELPPAEADEKRSDVFLRAPKGVSTKYEEKPWNGLYRYPGSAGTTLSAVYLGWAGKRKDLKGEIVRAFGPEKVTETPYTTKPAEGLTPVALDTVELKLKDRRIYLFLAEKDTVAVLYEVPAGKSLPSSYGASLNSLAVGASASTARLDYNKRYHRGR